MSDLMAVCAAYFPSQYADEHIRAVIMGDGKLAIGRVDGPIPDLPTAAIH